MDRSPQGKLEHPLVRPFLTFTSYWPLTGLRSAVNEIGPVGNLQSFLVDEEGSLTLVDTVPTGGNGPTYTEALSTGEVSAMNVRVLVTAGLNETH